MKLSRLLMTTALAGAFISAAVLDAPRIGLADGETSYTSVTCKAGDCVRRGNIKVSDGVDVERLPDSLRITQDGTLASGDDGSDSAEGPTVSLLGSESADSEELWEEDFTAPLPSWEGDTGDEFSAALDAWESDQTWPAGEWDGSDEEEWEDTQETEG